MGRVGFQGLMHHLIPIYSWALLPRLPWGNQVCGWELLPRLSCTCVTQTTAKERHRSSAVLKTPKEADCGAGTSAAPLGPQPGNLRVDCSYFISRKEADAIDPEYYLPNEIQGTEGWGLDVSICSLLFFLPLLPWKSFARMPRHCQNTSADGWEKHPCSTGDISWNALHFCLQPLQMQNPVAGAILPGGGATVSVLQGSLEKDVVLPDALSL